MAKTIGVWGSPYSGKTLISCAVAGELAMRGKEVIIIFADNVVPTIPVLFPQLTSQVGAPTNQIHSIGKISKTADMSENDILGELVSLPNFKHIGMLGYAYGENENSYPPLYPEDVSAMIANLSSLCDYIIVDCTSDFFRNAISEKVLEAADKIVRVGGCSYEDLSYFASQMRRADHFAVKLDEQIMVMNKISWYDAENEARRFYQHVNVELPYVEQINDLRNMGKTLHSKFPKKFDAGIGKLCEELISANVQ